ncbi:MAG: peptidase acyl-coenzyme A:6-aminopenicillanic acid acyl-transferase [Myxococcales bacterium]|nr:peptidase acyl-coenzyme A:6-aminopenicillanic acid acyl-transferase [Myxococcales bacterium]
MPDLVIGGRRSGPPRPWRSGVIAIALLGVAVVVAWFIYRRSVAYEVPDGTVEGEVTESQAAPGSPALLTYGPSSLEWVGGVAVLRATGDAHAIGAAHGRLLAQLLPSVVDAARPSIEGTVSDDGLLGGATHNMRLAWRWRFIDDGLVDTDRRMIAGLTRGAAASGIELGFDDLLRDQAVIDVGAPAQRSGEADRHSLARTLTVIAQQAQAPARVWIGRSFALPGLADGGDSAVPVVTIAHPEGKLAWASVGWPGFMGVVSGINAEGIAVMVDPARTADVRPTRTARPVALLVRMVLEQAKTLDEAIKLVEQTPTLGAASMIIVDGSTGKWLVVERTPSKAIVERNPKLPAFGDVLTTNALSSDPENDRTRRMSTSSRVERAAKLVRSPLADITTMAAVMRDQRGLDDVARPPGHRGVVDDGRAAHTLILDPASMEMWVTDAHAAGRMRGFDLRHELRGEGDRSAPPADLPADLQAEPDRALHLAAARAELRIARDALARGNRTKAAEACARARARAPALPEAIELEAMLAQERGDDVRARRLFQQWLDAGPDDPQGEERARALLAR